MTDSDDEATLEKLLRGDLPPARDPLFRIAVLARLERQRFQRRVASTVAVAAAATAFVVVGAAVINVWLGEDVTRLAVVLVSAAMAAWTGGRLVPAGLRNLVRTWFARVTRSVSRAFVG